MPISTKPAGMKQKTVPDTFFARNVCQPVFRVCRGAGDVADDEPARDTDRGDVPALAVEGQQSTSINCQCFHRRHTGCTY